MAEVEGGKGFEKKENKERRGQGVIKPSRIMTSVESVIAGVIWEWLPGKWGE